MREFFKKYQLCSFNGKITDTTILQDSEKGICTIRYLTTFTQVTCIKLHTSQCTLKEEVNEN